MRIKKKFAWSNFVFNLFACFIYNMYKDVILIRLF